MKNLYYSLRCIDCIFPGEKNNESSDDRCTEKCGINCEQGNSNLELKDNKYIAGNTYRLSVDKKIRFIVKNKPDFLHIVCTIINKCVIIINDISRKWS